ncbi:MAG TPA: cell division topological specificity factor MinE [Gammaproteobacteria bacterium]|nr:cell division topological specificity factor MinE [Gammaproteobacteria bacterium]
MKIEAHLSRLSRVVRYFRRPKKSAKVAKERLQIIIAHERITTREKPDFLSAMQRDLIDVIAKYVDINREDVKIELERQDGCSILELNVTLPNFLDKKESRKEDLVTG